jgi:uncharacterized membrane protein
MFLKILLIMHVLPTIVWVGSVYMGTFIDWPVAQNIVNKNTFPFRFIVGQGTRVYYSVYFGIILVWLSSVGLIIYSSIDWNLQRTIMIIGKIICLILMTGFTLYGTFYTWPKLQLATAEEAKTLYKRYMKRATGTFILGIIATIIGVLMD